ncbi:hypothetical protein D3C76_1292720 [compost metagenome]
MTARFRSIQCRHDTRRGVGALRCADHRANQHQAEQAGSQSAETGEQRKEDDGGHDDRAMAEAIGQLAHEQRRDAPRHSEDSCDQAEVLIIQIQVLHHDWEQRHDHEAIDADKPEAERQQGDSFPFI